MKLARKKLEESAMKKRELIDQLYQLVQAEADKENAYFDVKINGENPKKSRIIANRPGIELFATELMMETEMMFDTSFGTNHGNYSEPLIHVGKWNKRKTTIQFSDLELIDINTYENSFLHNSARSFNDGFFSSFGLIFKLCVYVLALFGVIAVYQFIAA